MRARSAATLEEFLANPPSASCARPIVSCVSAISRQGSTLTSVQSPIVWPVAGTMRRTRSISSPKNSMRTGEDACAGKASSESPCRQKLPGTLTSLLAPTSAYPMPTRSSAASPISSSSPTAKVEGIK